MLGIKPNIWKAKSFKHMLLYTGIVLLLLVPVLLHISKLPIRLFDEARVAINAYEMYHNGNYVVTYYNGLPDMWNTKPPLLIWLQVLFINLLGVTELAIRIPSILSSILLCIIMAFFSHKTTGRLYSGIIASAILMTTNGFIEVHVARSGEYDALLCLCTTAMVLFYYLYLKYEQPAYYLITIICVILVAYTKGMQGLIFLLPMFIATIAYHKSKLVFTRKNIIIAFLAGVIILSYYFIREKMNPGYLLAVWENEVYGRYSKPLEGHSGPFSYYFKLYYNWYYLYWQWFSMLGIIAWVFFARYFTHRSVASYLLMTGISYLLVISFSGTKIDWYLAPFLPIASYFTALFVSNISAYLQRFWNNKIGANTEIVVGLFLLIVFAIPYYRIVKKVYQSEERYWENRFYDLSYLLQSCLYDKSTLDLKNHKIIYNKDYTGYNGHLKFYTNILNERQYNIQYANCKDLSIGDKAIVPQVHNQDSITQLYNTKIIYNYYDLKIFEILEKK